ncbi:MAG: 50S ribosomal protein L29 [Bacilli bacterium]|jgi:large subunit ribosomal protein L29|nr:50S ribosomal protein L29 [Bacilli bacterium]MDD2681638.1 50S ribosomal protein L29 [Bacilli bacterium]MDD3120967.1 50S ribosomal protein L29 [Bacilli bacterium]MDD4063141.1 50S ribosomal protein L29 [Bacilli bacterium]MDD4481781.1 50S ribosomal protein L29 [Bacilli bacterium]
MARAKKVEAASAAKKVTETDAIRKLDEVTIHNKIGELKQELFNLRFQAAVGKLENTAQIGKTKKQIARMLTVLNERGKALK